MGNSLLEDKNQRVVTVDDTDYTARSIGTIEVRLAKDSTKVGTLTPSAEVDAAATNAVEAKASVDKAVEKASNPDANPEEVLTSIDQQLAEAETSLEKSQEKLTQWFGTNSKVVDDAQVALTSTKSRTKNLAQQLKDSGNSESFLKNFNEEYLPNLLQELSNTKEKTDKAAKVTEDIKGVNYTGTTLSDGNKWKVRGGADIAVAELSDVGINKNPAIAYDAVIGASGTAYLELTKEDGTVVAYINSATGDIVTPEDLNTKIGSVSEEEPGPGSMDIDAASAYTHRQLLGLNDILASICADFVVKDIKDIPLDDPPFGTPRKGKVLSATIDDTEYVITEAPDSILDLIDSSIIRDMDHQNYTYSLKHVFKKTTKDTKGSFVGTILLLRNISPGSIRHDFFVPREIYRHDALRGSNTVVFFIPWHNRMPTKKTTTVTIELQYPDKAEETANGYPEIIPKFVLSTADPNRGFWDVTLFGSDNTVGAFTSLLGLTEKFEDCEKRTDALYRKNNQKKNSTTSREVKATNISTSSNSSNTNATNNSSASVTTAQKWNFKTANASFSGVNSSSSSGSSSTLSGSSWSWSKPITILSSYGASSSKSNSGKSSGAGAKIVDNAKDALDKLFGKVASFFSKDTNTAKGEDLKKDEPLSVPDVSAETKTLASFLSSTPGTNVKEATREAVLYAASVNRQKVAYAKGRREYQTEHQSAVDNRKNRIAAKQSRIKNAIKMDVSDASNWA